MTYHSAFCDDKSAEICCGIPLLPIKTSDKSGAAPVITDPKEKDVIDEAIELYRAQILFKNFRVKGPADKVNVFLTSFIQKILQELQRHEKNKTKQLDVVKQIIALPIESQQADYFMNKLGLFTKPTNPSETAKMQKYLQVCKQETWNRLNELLYNEKTGPMDCKYWLMLGKKPFLGHKFVERTFT